MFQLFFTLVGVLPGAPEENLAGSLSTQQISSFLKSLNQNTEISDSSNNKVMKEILDTVQELKNTQNNQVSKELPCLHRLLSFPYLHLQNETNLFESRHDFHQLVLFCARSLDPSLFPLISARVLRCISVVVVFFS